MAINQILVRNISAIPLPIQAVFSRGVQFSIVMAPGHSYDLGALTDIEDVSRNPEIQNLITKGKITVTYAPGSSDLAPLPGVPDLTGRSVAIVQRIHLTAAVGGTADDVVVYTANSPAIRILDAWMVTSTAAGGSTCTARTAIAGAGTAVSSALASAAQGVTRSTLQPLPLLAAGSTLVIRRSDNTVAGDFCMLIANA